MIIDLKQFIHDERQYWQDLEHELDRIEKDPGRRMSIDEVKRFHYLYQRTSGDLAKLATFSAEPEINRYLESLISRAYAEIHETRAHPHRFSVLRWFFFTLPRTFRKHIAAFWLSLAFTLVGFAFGAMAISFDSDAKAIIMPFSHLQGDPSDRVAEEESVSGDRLKGRKMAGTSGYFTHNTRVSISTMALGLTWGIGTAIMLFYNGIILGAVSIDYILAGELKFLIAWLAPHGSVEIPAIILAGQAGLMLAGALIGWGRRVPLRARLREISGDLVTLVAGIALLLAWAGCIEAFVSQYHEPVIPYSAKIAFGAVEFILLVFYLSRSGASRTKEERQREVRV